MHTIFINTAVNGITNLDVSKIFANLQKKHELIILNESLENLTECACRICDLITKNAEITEQYNLIVNCDNNESINQPNAEAYVYEEILTILINESFIGVLSKNGRKPTNVTVIFNENFSREDSIYYGSDSFANEKGKIVWKYLPLPTENKVLELAESVLKSEKNIKKKDNLINKLGEKFNLLPESNPNNSLIKPESETFKLLKATLIEQIAGRITNNKIPVREEDLQEMILNSFETIGGEQIRKFIKKGINKIYYQKEKADVHKRNRNEFRLYLYVFISAISKNVYKKIPDVNWSALQNVLLKRKGIFEKELIQVEEIEDEFFYLDINALGGVLDSEKYICSELIHIDEEVPNIKTDFDIKTSMNVRMLEKTTKEVISQIDEINKANDDKAKKFIVKSTESFNKGKDKKMSSKKYTKSDKKIESFELTIDYAKKMQIQTDVYIANQKELTLDSKNIENQKKEFIQKTDYYFKSIRKSRKIFVAGIIFVLLVVLPYSFIQYDIFTNPLGTIVFAASTIFCVASYIASYKYFRYKYKKLIIECIRKLRDDFISLQKQKSDDMREYKKRLSHFIPRSVCLKNYLNDIIDYEQKEKDLGRHKLYHSQSIKQYIKHIDNLLDLLGIQTCPISGKQEIKDSEYQFCMNLINIRKDIYSNMELYKLLDEKSLKDILEGEEV